MKCIISHEIALGNGQFKIFEAGKEYPLSETEGREHYFTRADETKINEEVTYNDAD